MPYPVSAARNRSRPPVSALLTSLTAHFSLDTATGLTLNNSGSGNNLTNVNGVTGGTGVVGGCGQFTGVSLQRLTSVDKPDFKTGDIDYTISAWVNADTMLGNMNIVTKDTGSTPGREYALVYSFTSQRFQFTVFDGSASVGSLFASALGAPVISTWYFIVCWHDSAANTVNIQVNNGTANSAATTGAAGNTTSNFLIGMNNAASVFWNGRIDEVAIWKRVLTSTERTTLYNSGSGQAYPFTGL